MHKRFRRRVILLIITLSLLIASYEILLTWQRYPTATINTSNMQQYYEHKHVKVPNQQLSYDKNQLGPSHLNPRLDIQHFDFDAKKSHEQDHLEHSPLLSNEQLGNGVRLEHDMRNRRTLRQLLEDPDIKQLPVKVDLDCTKEGLYSDSNYGDIVCINETQLWADMVQRGIDVTVLSDRQRKAALVRAVLVHLEKNDEDGKDIVDHDAVREELGLRSDKDREGRGIADHGGLGEELGLRSDRERDGYNEEQDLESRIEPKERTGQHNKKQSQLQTRTKGAGFFDGERDKMATRHRQRDNHADYNGESDRVREQFLQSEIEQEGVLDEMEVDMNYLKEREDNEFLQSQNEELEDDNQGGGGFETQIQKPEAVEVEPVKLVLQDEPVVVKDGSDVVKDQQHREGQVDDAQHKELEKRVDRLLVELFEQVPTLPVKSDDKNSVPTIKHHPAMRRDGKVDSLSLSDYPSRIANFNNGQFKVPTERAQNDPKLPSLVQQRFDRFEQPDHGNRDNYGNHDNYGNYDNNNDENQFEGQPNMPKWIPQEFVHNEDNLPYSNQRAPLDSQVQDPDSDTVESENLMKDDPLNSILVPMGHNPNNNAAPIVAKKKKSANKIPSDYFLGLNLDEDRPPPSSPPGPAGRDNVSSQASLNTSNTNSSLMVNVSNALNASNLNQNESNVFNAKLHKVSGGLIQMNDELFKLVGYTLPVNYDLRARRLPTEFDPHDPQMLDRVKYLNEAVGNSDEVLRGVTSTSLHPDLLRRAKFQQHQMKVFCSQNHIDSDLPLNPDDLDTLFQHLLYDDSKRLVFCYVPKNGCSNMKRMMLVLNGILPPESVSEKRPAESVLKQVHSFRNLTLKEALYKLRHYYKAVIVRNPMERLLSAYRNKLEPPLNYTTRKHFPDRLKAYILRKYDPKILNAWIDYGNYSIDLHPSFSDFLQFMVKFPLRFYNEHFRPAMELCYPCAVHYDYYLNFKSLEYDVYALMHFLGIPFENYPTFFRHPEQHTSGLVESYFGGVALTEKVKLFNAFSQELEFYYSLHPEEWGMHKEL